MIGKVFGRLTIIGYSHRPHNGPSHWICTCTCGTVKVLSINPLKMGRVNSCGCFKLEYNEQHPPVNKTHGLSHTPEYAAWDSMKQRCYNINNESYANYGARGITVCTRWLVSFENFYKDMGPRPENRTLERMNNDLGYSPENCTWASWTQQALNKRNTVADTITKAY